jgi:hypothetical protein
MKKYLVTLSLSLAAVTTFAQGAVNFFNGTTTLVSAGPVGQQTIISQPQGSYYFGLLTAPSGASDLSQFSFAGVYATNLGAASPGQFSGGPRTYVAGWLPGVTMSFVVAGWSSTLGHDWSQQWLSGGFGGDGFFGFSPIGSGAAGAPRTGVAGPPPLNLFGGGTGVLTGWNLAPVPEPSIMALAALGAIALMLHRRSQKRKVPALWCP